MRSLTNKYFTLIAFAVTGLTLSAGVFAADEVKDKIDQHVAEVITENNSWKADEKWAIPELVDPEIKAGLTQAFQTKMDQLRTSTTSGLLPPPLAASPSARKSDKPLLIVTHATYKYNYLGDAAAAINRLVKKFQAHGGWEIAYLLDDLSIGAQALYFLTERSVDYVLFSASGENDLAIRSPDVILAGGYFGGCLEGTLINVLKNYSYSEPLRIHYPMAAVFINRRLKDDTLLDGYLSLGRDKAAFGRAVHQDLDWIFYGEGRSADTLSFYGLDTQRLTIRIYVDGELVSESANGPHQVELRFHSDFATLPQ